MRLQSHHSDYALTVHFQTVGSPDPAFDIFFDDHAAFEVSGELAQALYVHSLGQLDLETCLTCILGSISSPHIGINVALSSILAASVKA